MNRSATSLLVSALLSFCFFPTASVGADYTNAVDALNALLDALLEGQPYPILAVSLSDFEGSDSTASDIERWLYYGSSSSGPTVTGRSPYFLLQSLTKDRVSSNDLVAVATDVSSLVSSVDELGSTGSSLLSGWTVWEEENYPVSVSNCGDFWRYADGTNGYDVYRLLQGVWLSTEEVSDSIHDGLVVRSDGTPLPVSDEETHELLRGLSSVSNGLGAADFNDAYLTNTVYSPPDTFVPDLNPSPASVDTELVSLSAVDLPSNPVLYLWDEFELFGGYFMPAARLDFSQGWLYRCLSVLGFVSTFSWHSALAYALYCLTRREITYYASLGHTQEN